MKKIILIFSAVFLFLIACNSSGADDKAKTNSATAVKQQANINTVAAPIDEAAAQKAMQSFSLPGAMHKWMANFKGTWDATVIDFMNPVKPDTTKATNTVSMTMNGLYQLSKFTGKIMGSPFEGQSTMAYDNAKKIFVFTWIDNLSSGITNMTGLYDEKTKTLSLKGYQTNPVSGADMDIREEMTMIDNDSYSMIMYGTGMDGKETKFMEANFKRRK